jgi:hypothetical protein
VLWVGMGQIFANGRQSASQRGERSRVRAQRVTTLSSESDSHLGMNTPGQKDYIKERLVVPEEG